MVAVIFVVVVVVVAVVIVFVVVFVDAVDAVVVVAVVFVVAVVVVVDLLLLYSGNNVDLPTVMMAFCSLSATIPVISASPEASRVCMLCPF